MIREFFFIKKDRLKPEGVKVHITSMEILDIHWDIWYDSLSEAQQHSGIVNADNCVKDWVQKHSAVEIL